MSLVPIAQWVLRIRLRRRAERRPHRGQSMVEFALIVPIFLLIILAFIEFSVAMSGMLNINFASRDAAAIAAQVGDQTDADCLILKRVEDDINRPTSRVEIQQVSIFRTDAVGSVLGSNVYERTGSTGCVQQDGSTLTVPYTIVTEGYPVSSRCRVLAGCGPGQEASTRWASRSPTSTGGSPPSRARSCSPPMGSNSPARRRCAWSRSCESAPRHW